MSQWVIKGIRTGIKTTAYPSGTEGAAGVTPGLPRGGDLGAGAAALARTEKSRWTAVVAFTATVACAASMSR
jgi:hypothetical protein